MKRNVKLALLLALCECVYIALVAIFMSNAEKIFGKGPSVIGIMAFLTLFVMSAAISGALILGKPALLYLDNKKKEALEFFILTIAWLFIILIAMFVVFIFVK